MKRCGRCGEAKPDEAFARDRSMRDGLQGRCRSCQKAVKAAADQESARASQQRYRDRMRAEHRAGVVTASVQKRCPGCGCTKSADAFQRCATNKDGLQTRCRDCRKAIDKARYAANPEHERQRVRDYRAADPERAKQQYRNYWTRRAEREPRYWIALRLANLERRRAIGRANYRRYASRYAAYQRDNRDRINARRRAAFAADPNFWRTVWIEARARRRAQLVANGIEHVDLSRVIARDRLRCHICHRQVTRRELSLDHLIPVSRGGPHAEWNLAVAHRRCNFRRGTGRLPAQLLLPLA